MKNRTDNHAPGRPAWLTPILIIAAAMVGGLIIMTLGGCGSASPAPAGQVPAASQQTG